MLKSFDRMTLQGIALEVNDALAPLAEKYGVAIECGGGDFIETNANLALRLSIRDATGQAITRERSEFERYAAVFGLKPDDFGRDFMLYGHSWTIAGLKPGRPKYPILATKHCDGRLYKLPADVVSLALNSPAQRSEAGALPPGAPMLRPWEAQAADAED